MPLRSHRVPGVAATLAAAASLAAGSAPWSPAVAVRAELPCVQDATIFASWGGYGNGAGSHLFAGETRFYGSRRALLRFAAGDSLPAKCRVDSVVLRLYLDRSGGGLVSLRLHRLTRAWGEGTSVSAGGGGAPAEPGDATWSHAFFETVAWDVSGGDFVAAPSAATIVGSTSDYVWGTTPELVSDVQSWVDQPGTDFGWILIGDEGATRTAKRFASRENEAVELRPLLVVHYTPPTAVARDTWTGIKLLFTRPPPEVRR
jgi:hypothetical protein